jgi:hypothetical protein
MFDQVVRGDGHRTVFVFSQLTDDFPRLGMVLGPGLCFRNSSVRRELPVLRYQLFEADFKLANFLRL